MTLIKGADVNGNDIWIDASELPRPDGDMMSMTVPTISRRQFYQQAAVAGIVTQAEALAAVGQGVIPAVLETIIAAMPAGEQFPARMLLTGADLIDRTHPLAAAVGSALSMTPADVDAFWQAAAAL